MEYNRRLAQMIQVHKMNISLFKKKNAHADADADYADTDAIDRHIYPSNLFYPPD
jgi:hypothetical protein